MSLVKVQGNASGTGTFTIASPNSNTDRTLTLPDNTGTILTTATAGVPVNGPAFSAYLGGSQTISNGTWTKVAASTELFDTNSNYDVSLYRFTPTVAGYYQISFCWAVNAVATAIQLALYKNGSVSLVPAQTAASTAAVSASVFVYANGSTDYFEFYVNLATGETHPAATGVYFQGAMVRAA
jgi:hypothetical protein